MASKNTVTLAFAGDDEQLQKTLDRVERGTKDMTDKVDRSSADLRSSSQKVGQGFDKVGERADASETRIMGLRDTVDGTAAIMQGPGEAGISAYLQGWADLASGLYNFAVPAIKAVVTTSLEQIATTAKAAAATAAGVAQQVAQWVVLGAQATAHAAKVAAAWVISMGPIALVAAAVAGLVVVFVKNWDTIKEVVAAGARWVGDRIEELVGFFSQLPRRIGDALATLAEIITSPYRLAFEGVKRVWNATLGGFGFSFGGWDPPGPGPKVPGFSFRIPEMHAGGIIPGPPGTEVPIMAMAGERMSARGQGPATTVQITVMTLDTQAAGPAVVSALRQYVRNNGPITGLAITA